MTRPDYSIVMPVCNEGVRARQTVESVAAARGEHPVEVVLVDDGSSDGSCDFVASSAWPFDVRLVEGNDLGVARARNLGAAHARGRRLVFLDAHVTTPPGWLDELSTMLDDPTVGLAGFGVASTADPEAYGNVYTIGSPDLTPDWDVHEAEGPFETPAVSGACIGCRADWFGQVGRFDPGCRRFGAEEIELALRTWMLGFRCLTSPRYTIAHYFKSSDQRGFDVTWEQFDRNVLRCALTWFDARRLQRVVEAVAAHGTYLPLLAGLLHDETFMRRRRHLTQCACRNIDWFFDRFDLWLQGFNTTAEETRRLPWPGRPALRRKAGGPPAIRPATEAPATCRFCRQPASSNDRYCRCCGRRVVRYGRPDLDVSVVVPHINDWPGIFFTVNQVVEQLRSTDLAWEIVVVDNGSKPETLERLRGLLNTHPIVDHPRLLVQEQVPGPPNARNAGASQARGRYVVFLDSHVLVQPGFFRRTVDIMERQPEIGLLHAALSMDGAVEAPRVYGYVLTLEEGFWGNHSLVRRGEAPWPVGMGGHAAFAVRRDQFFDIGMYTPTMRFYGGEEPYLDLKYWLLGSTCWVAPELVAVHLPSGRDYYADLDSFQRNFMIAAYTLGGEAWLDRNAAHFRRSREDAPEGVDALRAQAVKLAEPDRRFVQDRQVTDLDSLVAWFRAHQLA